MIARDGIGAQQPRAHDVFEGHRAQVWQRRRVGLRRRRQPFDETVQAIRFLVDHLEQLTAAFLGQLRDARAPRSNHRRDGRFDRRQRRAQVVRQRIEQRGLQRFVPPRGFGLARPIERNLQLLIQPFDLPPSGLGFRRASFCRRRQLAAHHRDDDERDERRPVAGVSDVETAGRDEVAGKGDGGHD